MTPKTTKPLLVLLDANVIIELHKLGIWSQILVQCQVFTTTFIVNDESKFYSAGSNRISIDLQGCVDNGSLTIIDASLEDLEMFKEIFSDDFFDSMHDGEKEVLALIATDKHEQCKFCTADGPAIKALAMMNKKQFGISLEGLLKQNGFIKHVEKTPLWCRERWYSLRITEGIYNFLNREGLR